jgi:hypothetical protein
VEREEGVFFIHPACGIEAAGRNGFAEPKKKWISGFSVNLTLLLRLRHLFVTKRIDGADRCSTVPDCPRG